MDVIRVFWHEPGCDRRFFVGKISKTEGVFRFEYADDLQAALDAGWARFPAFPEDKTYESARLFPCFSSRLPDRNRRDLADILSKYEMCEFDAFLLLKKGAGRTPTDHYEFE